MQRRSSFRSAKSSRKSFRRPAKMPSEQRRSSKMPMGDAMANAAFEQRLATKKKRTVKVRMSQRERLRAQRGLVAEAQSPVLRRPIMSETIKLTNHLVEIARAGENNDGLVLSEAMIRGRFKAVTARHFERIRQLSNFTTLADSVLERIALTLHETACAPGDVILEEGQVGQYFYIVDAGDVAVTKLTAEGQKHKIVTLGAGTIFGELSLLAGIPVTAGIHAETACTLLTLNRTDFLSILAPIEDQWNQRSDLMQEETISSIPLFRSLNVMDRSRINRLMHVFSFPAGATIYREGMPGHVLYVVLEGSVGLHVTSEDVSQITSQVRVDTVTQGHFFGEAAIISEHEGALRGNTCVADTDLKVAAIARAQVKGLSSLTTVLVEFAKLRSASLRDHARRASRLLGGGGGSDVAFDAQSAMDNITLPVTEQQQGAASSAKRAAENDDHRGMISHLAVKCVERPEMLLMKVSILAHSIALDRGIEQTGNDISRLLHRILRTVPEMRTHQELMLLVLLLEDSSFEAKFCPDWNDAMKMQLYRTATLTCLEPGQQLYSSGKINASSLGFVLLFGQIHETQTPVKKSQQRGESRRAQGLTAGENAVLHRQLVFEHKLRARLRDMIVPELPQPGSTLETLAFVGSHTHHSTAIAKTKAEVINISAMSYKQIFRGKVRAPPPSSDSQSSTVSSPRSPRQKSAATSPRGTSTLPRSRASSPKTSAAKPSLSAKMADFFHTAKGSDAASAIAQKVHFCQMYLTKSMCMGWGDLELFALAQLLVTKEVAKGELVVSQGSTSHALYFLLSGTIRKVTSASQPKAQKSRSRDAANDQASSTAAAAGGGEGTDGARSSGGYLKALNARHHLQAMLQSPNQPGFVFSDLNCGCYFGTSGIINRTETADFIVASSRVKLLLLDEKHFPLFRPAVMNALIHDVSIQADWAAERCSAERSARRNRRRQNSLLLSPAISPKLEKSNPSRHASSLSGGPQTSPLARMGRRSLEPSPRAKSLSSFGITLDRGSDRRRSEPRRGRKGGRGRGGGGGVAGGGGGGTQVSTRNGSNGMGSSNARSPLIDSSGRASPGVGGSYRGGLMSMSSVGSSASPLPNFSQFRSPLMKMSSPFAGARSPSIFDASPSAVIPAKLPSESMNRSLRSISGGGWIC